MRAQAKQKPTGEAPFAAVRRDLRLGSILAAEGKIDTSNIARVLRLQQGTRGLRFGEAALSLGLISRDDLRVALAKQYDFPCMRVNGSSVSTELIAYRDTRDPRVERLRALRTQLLLRWYRLGTQPRALAIVSPGPDEGRSYVTANLAVLFAQLNLRTLVIDADLRAPRQSDIFDVSDRIGLSAVLSGRAAGEVAAPLPAFGPLWLLPAGATPPNPQELLLRPEFGGFLEYADGEYDVILIDTPPACESADVQGIAHFAGSALILARTNHTRLDDVAGLELELADAGALVLGVVLNGF